MKSVLILDDNPQNNSEYIDPVKKCFDVDVAMRIVSAKRMLRHKVYDFIVIDVMMSTQGLESDDEMTTGFVFYRDVLKDMNLSAKIVFWSRLDKESFDEFWSVAPKNSTFLHKAEESEHLRDHLLKLDV